MISYQIGTKHAGPEHLRLAGDRFSEWCYVDPFWPMMLTPTHYLVEWAKRATQLRLLEQNCVLPLTFALTQFDRCMWWYRNEGDTQVDFTFKLRPSSIFEVKAVGIMFLELADEPLIDCLRTEGQGQFLKQIDGNRKSSGRLVPGPGFAPVMLFQVVDEVIFARASCVIEEPDDEIRRDQELPTLSPLHFEDDVPSAGDWEDRLLQLGWDPVEGVSIFS
jgi:hypothetical protein